MTHMRLWAAAAIIGFVVIAGFALSVPRERNVALAPGVEQIAANALVEPTVVLRDAYKKGVHTLSGTVQAQNACATVQATASLVGDAPGSQSIVVALTVSDDSGVCLQLPTAIPFSATISAPANLPLSTTVNGKSVPITP